MSITTAAAAGVQVNSAAKDSAGSATALGSQSAALPIEIIMPEAITANNEGNLMASPTYVGRIIRIRDDATGIATAVVASGGTGHAVDDIIPLSGGTAVRHGRIRVTAISGSEITAIAIEGPDVGAAQPVVGKDRGEYSVEPGNPVSQGTPDTGSGTGATFTITWKNVEENRYCDTDTSNTLKVHEAWIDGPVGGTLPNDYRVSYVIQDAATRTGLGLISKRVTDYTSSRRFQVTNAEVNGGWIAFLDGVSLEMDDNDSSTVASFTVVDGGEFWNGYLAGSIPVSGGYLIGTTDDGDLGISFEEGSKGRIFDQFSTNVRINSIVILGDVEIRETKLFRYAWLNQWFATSSNPILIRNMRNTVEALPPNFFSMELKGGANLDVDGLLLFGAQITNDFGDTAAETITVRNVGWVGPGGFFAGFFAPHTRRMLIETNKIWNMVNPRWGLEGLTPDNDLDLTNVDNISQAGSGADNGIMNEQYSIDLLLSETDGTVIIDGKLYIVEALTDQKIDTEIQTDANGEATGEVTVLTISGVRTSSTSGTGPIAVTGLDFNDNSPSPDTITRSDGGSFITDGHLDIDAIIVGTSSADNGLYRIASGGVAAATITLQESGVLSGTTGDTAAEFHNLRRPTFTRFGDFAVRAYKYGFEPFIGSQVFDTFLFGGTREGEGGFKPAISLPVDNAITEATQATAISNGSGITVSKQLTLPYDGQTGDFTVGQVVTGTTSGAVGTILFDDDQGTDGTLVLELVSGKFEDGEEITDPVTGVADVNSATGGTNLSYKVFHYDGGTGSVPTLGETITVTNGGADTTGELVEFLGDATEGTLVLENWNGVEPDNNGAISGSSSSFAALADISGGGSSFNEEYFWLANANAKTMTVVYDYMMARLSETTLVNPFEDVIIWGEDEVEKVVFSGANGFSTKRNVNLTQGVWIANRGAGDIEFFTSDGGNTFTPPIEVTVTFDQMKDNSEVRVYEAGTNIEIAGIEDATAGSPDNRNFAWSAVASLSVDYVIHNWQPGVPVYETIRVNNFTVPTTNQTIIIQQRLDRNAV